MAPPAANSNLFARASLFVVGLMWTLPFLQPYHRYPIPSFYSEWLAFALGLTAAFLLLRKALWRDAFLPASALAPLGLVVVLGLQVVLGRVPYAEQALVATLYLLWASLLMLLGRVLRSELGMPVVVATLAWFLLAGGVLGALAGLLQFYQAPAPVFLVMRRVTSSIYGNLGQPNHFASYVTLALASAVYLYGCGRLRGVIAAGCAALLLLVLALAGSRSPWLYLGALTALAAQLHRLRRDADSRLLVIMSLWLLPGFIAAQWVVTLPFMEPAKGIMLTSAERLFQPASGIESRLQLWGEAWDMFLSAPLVGAGFGQFAWHHFLHEAATGAGALPDLYNHSHNLVMQLLAEAGILGALIAAGGILLWLADLRRVKFGLEWWWLLALLAIIGIHSLLEYPLWYAYFLGVAAFLMGLGAERVSLPRLAGAARGLVVLAVIVGWSYLAGVLSPYRDFERLVFSPDARNLQTSSERDFGRAIADIHREPLLTRYVELAVAYSVTVNDEKLPEKLALATRVMHFAPVSAVVYRQALLTALAGQHETAIAQLKRALSVYPEDAGEIALQLKELLASRPREFAPLLELVAAKAADLRALTYTDE